VGRHEKASGTDFFVRLNTAPRLSRWAFLCYNVLVRNEIKRIIGAVLKELGIAVGDVHLEHPEVSEHGDYATNAALRYASEAGKGPRELAEALAEGIRRAGDARIEKTEVDGPGFVNITLSQAFFDAALKEVLEKRDGYGKNEALAGKKIIVEYTDPNPFKEFHIGHLMSNAIGESLSRLLEFSGAEVKRACYQGDVGLHVAKALWGKREKPDAAWGEAYAHGAQNYEANKEAIDEINKKIYAQSDKEIMALYEKGRQESLDYFESIYHDLGTRFDFYFFESETGVFGKKVVEENTPAVFHESDGATVFRGEEHGLHTRVFVTSQELPTYEAKELGLAKIKHDAYPYDESVVITGNEVRDYFKVVHKAMEFVFPELAAKTVHIPHGMLRLPSGKMSSRTGDVITAEALIDEAKKRILEKMEDTALADKEQVAKEVAIGAVKYSILKNALGNDIIFEFDASLSFEGSSGPYLEYSYARARSVIAKARKSGVAPSLADVPAEKGRLERLVYQFPEVVSRAREEYAPQYVATYLIELAQAFNGFYAEEHIADSPYRLAQTEAVAIVLKNGLWLLGIPAPERM